MVEVVDGLDEAALASTGMSREELLEAAQDDPELLQLLQDQVSQDDTEMKKETPYKTGCRS